MKDIIQNQSRIQVGILETHGLLREGVASLVANVIDFECAGAWATADQAVHEIVRIRPDILLVGCGLPGRSAFRLLEALPSVSPRTQSILLVDCTDETDPSRPDPRPPCLWRVSPPPCDEEFPEVSLQVVGDLGIQAILPKRCSFELISRIIRSVHTGTYRLALPAVACLTRRGLDGNLYSVHHEDACSTCLTLREKQIIGLIASGLSNKEISIQLDLAYSTVKNHVSHILEKLGLSTRTQIVAYVVSHGLR